MKNLAALLLVIIILGFLGCEKEVDVTPPDEPPPSGVLVLDSEPEGASIYLDGKERRRITPDSLTWLDEGEYQVTLKKKYFNDYTFQIIIPNNGRSSYNLDYSSIPQMLSNLEITSKPSDAKVTINGTVYANRTPLNLTRILPGLFEITIEKEGYSKAEKVVELYSGDSKSTSVTLYDKSKWTVFDASTSPFPGNSFSTLYFDKVDNTLYAGTTTKGLMVYKGDSWQLMTLGNSELPNDQVRGLKRDNAGRVWVWGVLGFAIKGYQTWIIPFDGNNPPFESISINDIEPIGTAAVFATQAEAEIGSYQVANDGTISWNSITDESGFLPYSNEINAIAHDPATNNTYYATAGRGIMYTIGDTPGFYFIDRNNQGIPSNNITHIELTSVNDIWIASKSENSNSGYLSYYDGVNWNTLLAGSNITINNIFITENNIKWIAANNGVYRVDENNNIVHWDVDETGFYFGTVNSVIEVNGFLWIATDGQGLVRHELDLIVED